jgi:hypothetical protein
MRPSFRNPVDVIAFIKQCVAANDPKSLYSACSQETSDFWKPHIFQDFCDIQQLETLDAVFLQDEQVRSFPVNVNIFTLGGCDVRTKHLNISLEKLDDYWFIKTIWKCR